jgi:Zn-finger nucleic acid-binding protein
MPLLTSPIDGSPMKQINRYGIEIDVCPTTGGVWLDKGELEKILAIVREVVEDEEREEQEYEQRRSAAPAQQPQAQPMAQPVHYQQAPPVHYQQQPYGKPYKYDDDDDHYKYNKGYGYKKKSKLKSILDMFD